jgi:hypothetical protein
MITRPELDNCDANLGHPTLRDECLCEYIISGVILTDENYHRPLVRILFLTMVSQYLNRNRKAIML